MTRLEKAAQAITNRALDIRKDEAVLIIADEPYLDLARLLFTAAERKSRHTHLLQLSQPYIHKHALCPAVERLMQEMNVVLVLTSESITHTASHREACRRGARFITMPAITNETFARIADMDIARIGRLSRKIADILTIAKVIEITAPNGTRLRIGAESARGFANTGEATRPGSFSNMPAGEASLAPAASGTEGEAIVDSGMGVQHDDRDRLILTIREGRCVRIAGGDPALRLRRRLAQHGPEARMIAKFGIGTNDASRLSGCALEDETVLGNIHLALGNNLTFGGTNDVPIHLDAVVYKANVVIDGRRIIDGGRLLLE